ncbi:MAG: hypothetical protein MUD17_13560 [Gemmatimonadaceae bacterium]|nr:hypothetical protein [Gemmatimonadaceae bacterium]
MSANAQSSAANTTIGAEWSTGVAWNPNVPRAIGLRRLTPAELRLAQQRATDVYAAFAAAPSFRTPVDRAHLVTSDAGIEAATITDRRPVLRQNITAYFTVPRDARRLANGVLAPKLGGAHDLVYFALNTSPSADQFVDRATAGDFSRGVQPGATGGVFAAPRVLDTLAGGFVYADLLVFTRDGRSPLEPAPIGPLLDLEIPRLQVIVNDAERGSAERIREAEASLAPDAVAERRAKREAIWRTETPDPAVLTQRLDAAHRTDMASVEETRRQFTIPTTPDPLHRYWGPKLALDAARALADSLGLEGRTRPACGWTRGDTDRSDAVRYAVVGARDGCVPMMRVRADLIDPTRPLTEVQLLMVFFRGSNCGEMLAGVTAYVAGGRCGYGVPLLRELNWAALRSALGWSR